MVSDSDRVMRWSRFVWGAKYYYKSKFFEKIFDGEKE